MPNGELLNAYYRELLRLTDEYNLPGEVDLPTLLRLPGIFTEANAQESIPWEEFEPALSEACRGVLVMRREEGKGITKKMTMIVREIKKIHGELYKLQDAQLLSVKERLAERLSLKLMVGHLLLYHPAVTKLKSLIDSGELGDIYYMYTQRLNLGVVRSNENAWWSLAPHDVSVINHLFSAAPARVSAQGQCYLQKGIEDVVFATLYFADGRLAQVHTSWLDPHKMRRMTIVGSQKMVTFDDMEPSEKVWIYDKGATANLSYSSYGELITLRQGDIYIPKLDATEPLKLECQHFVDCVVNDAAVRTGGRDGAAVVKVLEAGQRSIEAGGRPEEV
jgi:predicted dehydrogenase